MNDFMPGHVSFSQLSQVEECPYQYYLLKLAGVEAVPNGFAQAGNLAHQLLAGWAKGEIPVKDLPVLWIERFPKEVTAEVPRFLAAKQYKERLFDAVLVYLESFSGFPGYDVVGAEQAFTSSIAGEPFVGIIDLILRDRTTGGLTLVDFKSCSMSSFKKNREQMYRQLQLYAKYTADTYGRFPDTLRFELMKENTYDERQFIPEDFMAARIWAETVIQEMKARDMTDWFTVRPEYFRCTCLCSCRNECSCGKTEYFYRKDEKHETKRTPAVA